MNKNELSQYFDKIYFCAGARNESLLHFFDSPMEFILDERTAAFMALGEAKLGKKIALCTTSGTAVLECIPALCEAFYSGISLTLISADRPMSLANSAAPQTIDQINPLKSFAHHQYDVESFEGISIKEGVNHINIHLGESTTKANDEFNYPSYSKTLFLISHGLTQYQEIFDYLKEQTDYYYFEVLTGLSHLNKIEHEQALLKLYENGSFDSIIRIGHTPLSKLWRVIDQNYLPVWHLDPRGFKGLSYGKLEQVDNSQIVLKLKEIEIKHNTYHGEKTIDYSRYPFSQYSFIHRLSELLPDNAHIYLGNSSLIRDFEVSYKKTAHFYGNRGANGIDGQLASAIGISKNLEEDLYICLGDLTFEYDLSTLKYLPKNCKLIIFNNGGGRIFERIQCDSKIILSHDENYEAMIRAFDRRYTRFENLEMSIDAEVIELKINSEETLSFFRELK